MKRNSYYSEHIPNTAQVLNVWLVFEWKNGNTTAAFLFNLPESHVNGSSRSQVDCRL
jgi:hypothetical protein